MNTLLEYYQDLVNNIPDIRQCCQYPEETVVLMLTHMNSNHTKCEPTGILLLSCMKITKGICNPAIVKLIIEEWKNE